MAHDEQAVAVVTGGNRGIGFELCRQLADDGFRVAHGGTSHPGAAIGHRDDAASSASGAAGIEHRSRHVPRGARGAG